MLQTHQNLSAELCLQVADLNTATELIISTAAAPHLATVMPQEAPTLIADNSPVLDTIDTEEAESNSQMSSYKVRHSRVHDAPAYKLACSSS